MSWLSKEFSKRRSLELGPEYNCRKCIRPERDDERGCPTCSLITLHQDYREKMQHEAWLRYRLRRGIAWETELWPYPDYPIDYLIELYHYISGLLSQTDGRIDPSWSLFNAALAKVILEEHDHIKEWEGWPEIQEYTAKLEQEKRLKAHLYSQGTRAGAER